MHLEYIYCNCFYTAFWTSFSNKNLNFDLLFRFFWYIALYIKAEWKIFRKMLFLVLFYQFLVLFHWFMSKFQLFTLMKKYIVWHIKQCGKYTLRSYFLSKCMCYKRYRNNSQICVPDISVNAVKQQSALSHSYILTAF